MHVTRVTRARMRTRKRARMVCGIICLALGVCLLLLSLSGHTWQTLRVSPESTPSIAATTPETREMDMPGTTWYALQLGAFDQVLAARAQAQQFSARGAAGYVRSNERHQVLAAAYPTREEAERVRARLTSEFKADSYIVSLSRDHLLLSVSGQTAQLDALQEAYQFLCTLESDLYALSLSLDKQELEPDMAVAGLVQWAHDANARHDGLTDAFSDGCPEAALSLRTMLANYLQIEKEAGETADLGLTALSAHIKYAHIQLIDGLCAYHDAF